MVKINLLPDVVLERRRQARIRRIANLAIMGWVGLFVLVYLSVFAYSRVQVSMRNNALAEEQRLESIANSEENVEFRREALAVQASLDALAQLFETRQSAGQFLQVLSDNATGDMRIRDLIFGQDGAINISGTARSYQAVGEFEQALKVSANRDSTLGYFQQIALFGASLADQGAVNFELRTGYVPQRPTRTVESTAPRTDEEPSRNENPSAPATAPGQANNGDTPVSNEGTTGGENE